jgi:hypothetical protein
MAETETETETWVEIDGCPLDNGKVPIIRGLPRIDGIYNSLERLIGIDIEENRPLYRVLHHDAKPVPGKDVISVAYVGENDDMYKVLEHPIGYGAKRIVEASVKLMPQEAVFFD